MVAVGRVYVRACGKLVRSIEKYLWVLMVEVRVDANFIVIHVADELRMVADEVRVVAVVGWSAVKMWWRRLRVC
jgi:hypothetical protein